MLLRTDREGWNAWHIALIFGIIDVINKMFVLAKDILTREEIKREMILRTDDAGSNA
jgi:hypothetical protein